MVTCAQGMQRAWISSKVMRLSTSTQIMRATRSRASRLTAGRKGQEYLPARAPAYTFMSWVARVCTSVAEPMRL